MTNHACINFVATHSLTFGDQWYIGTVKSIIATIYHGKRWSPACISQPFLAAYLFL